MPVPVLPLAQELSRMPIFLTRSPNIDANRARAGAAMRLGDTIEIG